jgi:hypothetical protein
MSTIDFGQIVCQICNRSFNGQITGMHLKSHGTNSGEYKKNYGSTQTIILQTYIKLVAPWGGGGSQAAKDAVKKQVEDRKKEYYKNPKICKLSTCDIFISYEKHALKDFCCRSHSAKFNNQLRPKTKKRFFCTAHITDNEIFKKCNDLSCNGIHKVPKIDHPIRIKQDKNKRVKIMSFEI